MAPATYEPKRSASPTTTNKYNEQNTLLDVNFCAKESLKTEKLPTDVGDLEESDRQEGKDAVPELIPFHHHVEHPECLPRPLTSPDRSSRCSEESNVAAKSKTSIWQRGNESGFRLQGGAFQHKTPSPLKNMIVTGTGACPKAGSTLPKGVSRSESEILSNNQKDAGISLSVAHTNSDPKELHQLKSPLLKTSRSVPPHGSKVSSLRRMFDSSLPSSVSMPYF
jgi:hypothetical protein